MMAGDLVVRLWLNSQGFDRNIEKSTKQARKFKDGFSGSAEQVSEFSGKLNLSIGILAKFAGGLGAAAGAFGVINEGLQSNAVYQDKFNELMSTGKGVVSQFFSSLYSGDWTVFNDGIMEAIENARTFAEEYRKVRKSLVVNKIGFEQKDALKNQLESIIEDDSKTSEERKKAQRQLDKLLIMGIADIREMSDNANKALESMIKQVTGTGKFVNSENAQSIVLRVYDENSDLRKTLEGYRAIRDMARESASNSFAKFDISNYRRQIEARKQLDLMPEDQRNKYDELLRLADNLNEEMFNSFKDLFDELNDLNDKAGTWEKDRAGARDEILGIKVGSTSSKSERYSPEIGSLAMAEKLLATWRDKFNKATTEEARSVANRMVQELNGRIVTMKVQYDVEYKYGKREDVQSIEPGKNLGLNIPIVTPDFTTLNQQLQQYKKNISSDGIKLVDNNQVDTLNSMANLLGSINTLTGDGVAGWLSWSSSIMQAIAQVIPSLNNLTTAQTKAAASGAAASVASIPVVGWIMAGTAVASVLAAIMSAPKFATGGIVPGISYAGDKVPVMANSGEMILNRAQQGRLFDMLNNGGGRSSDVRVTGELVARGSNLVAVIRNSEKLNSKMR
ncbi:hypothetical protein [Parabacteroides merdae]|uniref:Phage tail tape measure protein n=1 Tax=Parabacteroides merdae TaxID=46503 RepID=A0A3R6E9K1_9BACT|nr:hypothetical protein [Parabacteroides merdae]RHH74027.1 hypothetical protein DW191_19205 [Parabacteroides merdae]